MLKTSECNNKNENALWPIIGIFGDIWTMYNVYLDLYLDVQIKIRVIKLTYFYLFKGSKI